MNSATTKAPTKGAAPVKGTGPKGFDLKGQIGSLAARLNEAQPGEKIIKLPLDKVRPNPKQHRRRFNQKTLQELGESIKNSRQELPCIVRPSADGDPAPYTIISGERRWRACGLAGVATIDAVVRNISPTDEKAILLAEASENLHRVDLHVSEQATLFADLVATFGMEAAIEKTGLKKPRISKIAGLAKAPPVVAEVMSLDLTEDVETLYQLSLLAKDNESAAVQLVERWKTDPDSREFMRQQVEDKRNPDRKPARPPSHQNAPVAKSGDRSESEQPSAIHSGSGGRTALASPAVGASKPAASSALAADKQRSEPTTGKTSGGSTGPGDRPDDPPFESTPALVATKASFQRDVVVLETTTGIYRFDRAALTEVLGLDG